MTPKQKKILKWVGLVLVSALVFWLLSCGNLWFVFVLMLIMIGLHEYGHLLAAKYVGVQTAGFYFIPLGGVSFIKENPQEQWKKFIIAYGGPLVGLFLCAIAVAVFAIGYFHPFGIGMGTSALILIYSRQAIFIWSAINLFNLLPIYPLDGGRLLAAIHINQKNNFEKYLFYISWIFLGLTFLYTFSFMIIFIGILFIRRIGRLEPDYYVRNPFTKKDIAKGYALYLVLIATFIGCLLVPYI